MEQTTTVESHPAGRLKFIIGGLLIVAAVVYLIISSTQASAQYFLTVDELISKGSSIKGRDVRISGAVIGDTVKYDPQTLNLTFLIASIPGDNNAIEAQGGLAAVLHAAVTDPNRQRWRWFITDQNPIYCATKLRLSLRGKWEKMAIFTLLSCS